MPAGPAVAKVARRRELGAMLRLAAPLIAGSAGNQLVTFVGVALIGRIGPAALAGAGIAGGLYFAFTVFGMGCVFGMDAPTAQAVGAGEPARARRILWQGIRVGVVTGVPLTVLAGIAPFFLESAGVDPAAAAECRRYMWGRLPSVIPFLLFSAARSYLQANGVTRPIVVAVVVANKVHAVAAFPLIFGDAALTAVGLPAVGLPALGVFGAGLAASVATIVSLWVLAMAIRALPAPADPDRRRTDPAIVRTIMRLGTPIGAQLVAEVGVFAVVGILAGRMSAAAAAVHQIALTLASFTFTVTLGFAAATAVRVGHAVGRGDTQAARRSGLTGIALASVFMAVAALVFLALPRPLARILTDSEETIAAAVPLVMIAAMFQISDGVQAVAAGALRGAGDPHAPLAANVIGHYVVGLPIAVTAGFFAGMGAPGLWWGLSAGLTVVAAILVGRFWWLSARPIRRV